MKKFVKICLLTTFFSGIFVSVLGVSLLCTNYIKFSRIPLNAEALASSVVNVEVFDSENRKIKENVEFQETCSLSDIPEHTKQAFLSIEDKEFYNHHGINKKRIVKAAISNIKTHSLKEGASTISQQLIKNTHLSGEKTFERKLKEIALTKKLEKAYTKDEILEKYLNVIFFGNNCYGLQSAAKYYFNKDAKDLNLQESCTLAGMIKSPTKYSPIHNQKNCLERRNLVLSEMQKDGFITEEDKIFAQNQPIKLELTKRENALNTFAQASIDEASKILGLSAKQIAVGGYKIHTYQDREKQQALANSLEVAKMCDCAGIVIDSQKYGVVAYCADSNYKILDCKRQPASCLKPLLVYGPALNEMVISPDTQILDEKVTIGDYSPNNVNKKYGGYMSVTDAVKNSINIPAIKVLSYIGIDTGKQYAEKMGITFDEKDDSYALALGGMTYGVNLKDLTNAYAVFNNAGEFESAKFVQYITDSSGKLVYVHRPEPKMVLREDSAYLMTKILQETAKSGTARKLSAISSTEVAAKTGTVGKKNAKGNTDAYCIAYNPSEIVGVWQGSLENSPAQIAGGNKPTEVAKNYFESQSYENITFNVPTSVTEAEVDALELEENHRLVLASPYAPERYRKTCLFSRFNMPTEVSENFAEPPSINAEAQVDANQVILTLSAQKHLTYTIFKDGTKAQTITNKNEPIKLRLNFPESETSIKIVAEYANLSESSKDLTAEKTFNLKKSQKSAQKQKWYI